MSTALELPPDSDLSSLHNLLTTSLNKLFKVYSAHSKPLPTINGTSSKFDPSVDLQPEIIAETSTAIAACYQIIASIENPVLHLISKTLGFHISSSVRVAVEAHVAEALRDAGEKGLQVEEIAKWSCIDPKKLARVLRVLAANHVFVETAPDVFANNRHSVVLDTGKSKQELVPEKQREWYNQTNGLAALIAHSTDDIMKSSAHLSDTLLDTSLSHSYDPNKAAISKAYNRNDGLWGLLNENPVIGTRFEMAMVGTMGMQDPKAIIKMFDWSSLPDDSLFVDVGGGMGQQSQTLLADFPHLKVIVQDQKAPLEGGKAFWQEKRPGAIESGKVVLMEHDFFKPQPIKGADVYFLRAIIHDWPDPEAITILSQIRSACSPTSVLLIVDSVTPNLCPPGSFTQIAAATPGSAATVAPEPLLPQFGKAGESPLLLDLQMLSALNGMERTIGGWVEVTQKAGFKIQRVTGNPTTPIGGCLVCMPFSV